MWSSLLNNLFVVSGSTFSIVIFANNLRYKKFPQNFYHLHSLTLAVSKTLATWLHPTLTDLHSSYVIKLPRNCCSFSGLRRRNPDHRCHHHRENLKSCLRTDNKKKLTLVPDEPRLSKGSSSLCRSKSYSRCSCVLIYFTFILILFRSDAFMFIVRCTEVMMTHRTTF
jgi:hypothetical protein